MYKCSSFTGSSQKIARVSQRIEKKAAGKYGAKQQDPTSGIKRQYFGTPGRQSAGISVVKGVSLHMFVI